jgi:lipopolysaccharide transport system permease protein
VRQGAAGGIRRVRHLLPLDFVGACMTTPSARLLFSQRQLMIRVARTELSARYAGSLFGAGWALLAPLLFLGVYAAVYVAILRIRPAEMTEIQYVLYVFCGLVPIISTNEAISNGVASIVVNKAIMSNTVFPIDLLPPKAALLSQGTSLVGFVVILVGCGFFAQVHWTMLLVPVLWGLLFMFTVGLNWILSLVTVVFRDLQSMVGIVLMVIMIASPIGYTPGMVPAGLKPLVALNPMAYFVIAFQKVIVLGELPSTVEICVIVFLSVGTFLAGSQFFARGKSVVVDYV